MWTETSCNFAGKSIDFPNEKKRAISILKEANEEIVARGKQRTRYPQDFREVLGHSKLLILLDAELGINRSALLSALVVLLLVLNLI